MTPIRLVGLVLTVVSVFIGIASATPPISWQPTSLTQTSFAGSQSFTVVQLISQTALTNISLRVVPQLAPFVSVSPISVSSIGKGQPLRVQVMFNFPSTMALGTLQGTIQMITSTPGVLPLPLPVTISILQPTSSFIPTFVSQPSPDRIQPDPASGTLFATNEIDVIFMPSTSLDDVRSIVGAVSGVFLGSHIPTQFFQLYLPASSTGLDELATVLEAYPSVVLARRHFLASGDLTPNEWNALPAIYTYGQRMAGFPDVWVPEVLSGTGNIDAVILDEGFNSVHVDLTSNFYDVGPNLAKAHGNGVAGILGAIGNNGKGLAGALWNAHIGLYGAGMADQPNNPPNQNLDDGDLWVRMYQIEQDAKNMPRIVNMSFGEYDVDLARVTKFFTLPILRARNDRKQILYVASAGDDSTRDSVSHYPSALAMQLCNVISTAAVDQTGALAVSSSGSSISVAAPGVNIFTTALPNSYDPTFSGTSAATPFVTGTGALLLAKENNRLSEFQLRDLIVSGSQRSGRLVHNGFFILSAPFSFDAAHDLHAISLPNAPTGSIGLDLRSFNNGLAIVNGTQGDLVNLTVLYSTNMGVSYASSLVGVTSPIAVIPKPGNYCQEPNHVVKIDGSNTLIFDGPPGAANASLSVSALSAGDLVFVEIQPKNSASGGNLFLHSHNLSGSAGGLTVTTPLVATSIYRIRH